MHYYLDKRFNLMNDKKFFAKLTAPVRTLYHREHTAIGKEQLSLLIVCYIPIMILGVVANFFGATEPSADFFNYTHSTCIVAAIVTFCLYYKQKIGIKPCLATFTLIGQTILSIEMVYCSLNATPYYILLIMANMVLLALNTMVAVSAYLKYNTIILGCATIGIYIACSFLSGDILLKSFIPVFVLAFVFVIIVGVMVSSTTTKLEKDNESFKQGEQKLLNLLRLRKDEVVTFFSLSAEKYDHDGTKMLLDRLDTKARKNLLNNVEEYLRIRKTDLEIIEDVFPELTPSEREICRLILQGKKLGDICLILNKSESNINSQRTNMRRKLGLKPSDNLQKKLQERLDSK